MAKVAVARVYDDPAPEGRRVLVDRLWPRGLAKARADFEWRKDLAPSSELRRWYGHDPARFDEFAARYGAELSDRTGELAALASQDTGPLVLLTATKDVEHSGATVLAAEITAAARNRR